MNNYKKDKSYIKQRLEYVSPVDYISELEGKIEYLEYLKNENERLNNIIDELEYWLKMEWQYNADVNEQYAEAIENTLDRLKELKGETNE